MIHLFYRGFRDKCRFWKASIIWLKVVIFEVADGYDVSIEDINQTTSFSSASYPDAKTAFAEAEKLLIGTLLELRADIDRVLAKTIRETEPGPAGTKEN